MKDGSKKISCMGVVGDGCGGGREFIVEDGKLFAYDALSKKSITLLKGIKNAQNISKKSCILTIECRDEVFEFDLSLMKKNLI